MTFTHGLSTNNYGPAKFIVSADAAVATHTTIAAALAVASSGDTIFIRDGTYTENLTLVAGVNLVGYNYSAVTIAGKCTATFAGTVNISNITLETNGDYFLSITGTLATRILLQRCFLSALDNTGMLNSSSSGSAEIRCEWCEGDIGTTLIGMFTMSGSGLIVFIHCHFDNSGPSVTSSTVSSGLLTFRWTRFDGPITSSSTASFQAEYSEFYGAGLHTTMITHNGTGQNSEMKWCLGASGTASCISVGAGAQLGIMHCNIGSTNTNAITGAGEIWGAGLILPRAGNTVNTTTQNASQMSNDNYHVTAPGAYPYTTLVQDAVIFVDTTGGARTITPRASPSDGARHIIKDNDGNAAANNVTITPSGKNIDGAASSVITTDYGSVEIVYNGTEWSIVTNTATTTGTLAVASGGTGATTLGDGFILLGSGTSPITALDVTAKGSLIVGDGATDPIALIVGTDTHVLTADSGEASGVKWAVASGAGDVVGPGSSTDNAIARFDSTTGKLLQDSIVIISDNGDITSYDAVNDGNPQIRMGASDAEEVHIQTVFDGAAQTLDYVLFQTDAASATANKGLYRFNVDGSDIMDIDDGGIDLDTGGAISINGTDVLDATTLGSAVVASSLTSVGTITTGVWTGTDVAVADGGTGLSVTTA